MGLSIGGPTNVPCDNYAVMNSTSRPESSLKKKSLDICYHIIREAIASGVIRVVWEKYF